MLADSVLRTAIEEHVLNGGSLAGRVSQLFLSDVLVKEIDQTLNDNSLGLREEVLRAVIDKMI